MKLSIVLLVLFIFVNIIKSNEIKLNSNSNSIINNIIHRGRLLKFEGLFNYSDNSTFESISLGSDHQPSINCRVIEYSESEIKCLLDQYSEEKGCLSKVYSSKLIGYTDGFKSIEKKNHVCNKPYVYKVNMVLEKTQENKEEFIITILGDNLGDYPNLGIVFGTKQNNFNQITNNSVSVFEYNRRTPLSSQDVSSISKEINKSTYYQFTTIQKHYAFLQVKVSNDIALRFKQQYENDQSLISFLVFSHNINEIDINHIHIEPIHWEDVSIKVINKPLFYFKCFSTVVTGLSILVLIIVSLDKKSSKKIQN